MRFQKNVRLKDGRECSLRNATAQDAAASLYVFKKTHAETDYLLSLPEEIQFTEESQAEYLQKKTDSDNEVELIAEVDGSAVALGGIDMVHDRIKTRHRAAFGVSVLKDYWGLGIGRALLTACIELSRQAGYRQLELDAVADNPNAIALYESLGFIEYGRNPRGFLSPINGWQPLVMMRLELDEK